MIASLYSENIQKWKGVIFLVEQLNHRNHVEFYMYQLTIRVFFGNFHGNVKEFTLILFSNVFKFFINSCSRLTFYLM